MTLQPPTRSCGSTYAARAREYESIYEKPERQPDLRKLERLLPDMLAGRRVLELACGTGYWTQFLSPQGAERRGGGRQHRDPRARRGEVACRRNASSCASPTSTPCRRSWASSTALSRVSGGLTCWCGSSRISRIARPAVEPGRARRAARQSVRGRQQHSRSRTGTRTGIPIQKRRLADGSEHHVLKNFPSEQELRAPSARLAPAWSSCGWSTTGSSSTRRRDRRRVAGDVLHSARGRPLHGAGLLVCDLELGA